MPGTNGELKDFKLPLDVYGLHIESFDDHKAKLLSGLSFAGQGDSGTSYLRFSYDDTFVEGNEKETEYLNNLQNALTLCKKYQMGAGFFLYMLFRYPDRAFAYHHLTLPSYNLYFSKMNRGGT